MSTELDKLKMLGYNIIEEMNSNICIKHDKIKIIPLIGDPINISTSGGIRRVFCRRLENHSGSIITIHPNDTQDKSEIQRGSREYSRRGEVTIYLQRCTAFCCRYLCDIGEHTIQINDNVVIDGDICVEIRVINNRNKSVKSAYLKLQLPKGVLLFSENGYLKVELVTNTEDSLSVVKLASYIICMETGVQIKEEDEPFLKNMILVEDTETKEVYALDRENKAIINMVTGIKIGYDRYEKGKLKLISVSNGELAVVELKTSQKIERLLGYREMYPKESEFYAI